MPPIGKEFPPVRACIFDLDGLLINSEDVITGCVNRLLNKYERPNVARNIRVQMMGIPDSTSSDLFHNWAKLPTSREQFNRELSEDMYQQFTNCEPLPGAEKLLSNLVQARTSSSTENIKLALASTTKTNTFALKSFRPETEHLLGHFPANRRILGDDSRIGKGRSKPAPDIYLLALQSLRAESGTESSEEDIQPHECLVFEDSVIGVEAGRRAGMRVVWVPHADVATELKERQQEVLAGKTGTSNLGDEWQLGEIDDGWAECISSLEQFDYEKYGIYVPPI